jgi:hypothetical protein
MPPEPPARIGLALVLFAVVTVVVVDLAVLAAPLAPVPLGRLLVRRRQPRGHGARGAAAALDQGLSTC